MRVSIKYNEKGERFFECPDCGHVSVQEFPIHRYQRTTYGRREITYKCPNCGVRLKGW